MFTLTNNEKVRAKRKKLNTAEVIEGVYLPRTQSNSDFTTKEQTTESGCEQTHGRGFLIPPWIWSGPGITDRQQHCWSLGATVDGASSYIHPVKDGC